MSNQHCYIHMFLVLWYVGIFEWYQHHYSCSTLHLIGATCNGQMALGSSPHLIIHQSQLQVCYSILLWISESNAHFLCTALCLKGAEELRVVTKCWSCEMSMKVANLILFFPPNSTFLSTAHTLPHWWLVVTDMRLML